ncbi:hypothetical protein H4R34_005227, partial [Dimargaris verticillata]
MATNSQPQAPPRTPSLADAPTLSASESGGNSSNVDTDSDPDWDDSSASQGLFRPLSPQNIGFKLLQKLGWRAGQGLGRCNQGPVDPVSFTLKTETLGLGKQTEYLQYHHASTAHRKSLQSEKIASESAQQRDARE